MCVTKTTRTCVTLCVFEQVDEVEAVVHAETHVSSYPTPPTCGCVCASNPPARAGAAAAIISAVVLKLEYLTLLSRYHY